MSVRRGGQEEALPPLAWQNNSMVIDFFEKNGIISFVICFMSFSHFMTVLRERPILFALKN